jgi:ubiquinone biosynthesis accessory factor UbiJ
MPASTMPPPQLERRHRRVAQGISVLSTHPLQALLNRVAATLNRNIAQSSRSQGLAAQLEGRALALQLDATSLSFFFTVDAGHIRITTERAGDADATLSGTPLALLSLVGPGAEDRLRGSAVRITGDAEVAQRFRELLQQAQPDFEEELSGVFGDVAAHQMANVARGFLDWGRKAADSLANNVAEYLQEEGRDVPSRASARSAASRN